MTLLGGLLLFAVTGAALTGIWIALTTLPRARRLWGSQLSAGPAVANQIAITFDDGPTPGMTDQILDVLAAADVKATFFVIGHNIRQNPDLLKRIAREGHAIGNHSYSHSRVGFLHGPWYWRREISETDALISQLAGSQTLMFRPPMGFLSPFIAVAAARAGHRMMIWTHRGMDGVETTPERILSRLNDLSAGSVIVLHDGVEPNRSRDPRATIQALPQLISRIRELGLEPVRLDELHGISKNEPQHEPAHAR